MGEDCPVTLTVIPTVQAKSLLGFLDQLIAKATEMSQESDRLVAAVTRIKTVADGMKAVLVDVKTRLDAAIAAGNDPTLLAALSADLETEADDIVAATIANTVSA